MLSKLVQMFKGKRVRITHIDNNQRATTGTCIAVHATPGEDDHFDIELEGTRRFGIIPQQITTTSAEGSMSAYIRGRRKIELI